MGESVDLVNPFEVALGMLHRLKEDPGRPRRFLREHGWKLLVSGLGSPKGEAAPGLVIPVSLCFPRSFGEVDRRCAEVVVTECLQLSDSETYMRQALALDSSSALRLEFTDDTNLESTRRRILRERVSELSLERWLRIYVRGRAFASAIGLEGEERFVYIEHVYQKPKDYAAILGAWLGGNSGTPFGRTTNR